MDKIPGYLWGRKKKDRNLIARYKCGNKIRESQHWKEEAERKSRTCRSEEYHAHSERVWSDWNRNVNRKVPKRGWKESWINEKDNSIREEKRKKEEKENMRLRERMEERVAQRGESRWRIPKRKEKAIWEERRLRREKRRRPKKRGNRIADIYIDI